MIRNYYIDIEDKFERLKLEAYMMNKGMKFFDATKLDPYTSMDPQTMSIEEIQVDITVESKVANERRRTNGPRRRATRFERLREMFPNMSDTEIKTMMDDDFEL